MTSLPPARRFDWSNLGVRVASAVVLVPAVLGAVWFADLPGLRWMFLVLVAVAVALLAIEWGAMTAPYAPVRVSTALTVAVLAGAFLAFQHHMVLAWAAVALGAIFLPLILLTIWMGVYPNSFLDPMAPAVDKLVGDYQAALKLARTAALAP